MNRRSFELGNLYGIRREAALFALLKKAKEDGSSIVLRMRKPDGTTGPVAEMRNHTELAHTMIGRKRLDNLQYCMETVLDDGVPGDFLEAGVWRGGAYIFMRGVLAAYGIADRAVWVADSFEGVPRSTHANDLGVDLSVDVLPVLAVPLEQVRELFDRYDLLDDQVRFLKGWFKDGGFVIVDDYHSCAPCQRAIDDFRSARGIEEPMEKIDEQSVFWRKRSQ